MTSSFCPIRSSPKEDHREDTSPRPFKQRRNSGPSMAQTPLRRPLLSMGMALPPRGLLLPKTPAAPRPHRQDSLLLKRELTLLTRTPPSPSHHHKLFLPSFDAMMDMPASLSLGETPLPALPLVAASRLQPRAMAPSTPPRRRVALPSTTLARTEGRQEQQPSSTGEDNAEDQQQQQHELLLAKAAETKAWPEGKVVPAPFVSTHKKSRSCHALCA